MSGSSQDLPRTPLPLTSQHRNEIDKAVLKRVRRLGPDSLKMIIEDEGIDATTTERPLVLIMTQTIAVASEFLRREHLKGNLDEDVAWAEGTLKQHPELRGMIRHACQTQSFSHIADLGECMNQRYRCPSADSSGDTDIFQVPQASDPRARSLQGQRL
jgi:hypothetical protein